MLFSVRRAPCVAIGEALVWSLLLFVLNLAWEVAQLPLYALGYNAHWPTWGYAVLHCTLGDAVMAFVAYLLAALVTRAPRWPQERPISGLAVALIAGEMFTVWAEWFNVYVLHSWAYAAGMPTIGGIGVAPLMQWLLLPTLAWTIFRYRRRWVVQI